MMDESLISLRSDASTGRLTPEEMDRLLDRLHPDREAAAREYLRLHYKLARYFEWRDVLYAEALADETLNRVARCAEPILNLPAYAMGVARNVLREFQRDQRRRLPDLPAPSAPVRDEELAWLEAALAGLKPDERELIRDYYREGQPKTVRQDLSGRTGLTLNALRIRACRIRDKLLARYLEAAAAGSAPGRNVSAENATPE